MPKKLVLVKGLFVSMKFIINYLCSTDKHNKVFKVFKVFKVSKCRANWVVWLERGRVGASCKKVREMEIE